MPIRYYLTAWKDYIESDNIDIGDNIDNDWFKQKSMKITIKQIKSFVRIS
jgi:hypothetical protein